MTTLGRTVRALAAATVILCLLAGVPLALWHVGRQLLDPSVLVTLVEAPLDVLLRPDDGTLLIAFLVAIGAIGWLMLAVSLVGELVAVIARRPTARVSLPGFRWSSSLAAALVAAVLGAGPAVAAPAPRADITLLAGESTDTAALAPTHPAQLGPSEGDPAPGPSADGPTHVVERRDTLWRIAETTLGDPLRWREIYELNAGRTQPDGGRLTEVAHLTVGWRLVLPADARHVVVVAPGDTLTGLAAEHLGDPALATELFDLNTAIPQPGGAALTDPDVIRPGWALTLPSPGDATAPADPPESTPRPSTPPRSGTSPAHPPPDPTADGGEANDGAENGIDADERSPSSSPESTTATDPDAAPGPGSPTAPDGSVDQEASPGTIADGGFDDDGYGDGEGPDPTGEQVGVVDDIEDDGPGWAVAAAGMSALIAGGVGVSLALHRRRQLRHRPARHRIAVPTDDEGRVEWALQHPDPTATATRNAAEHLDLALRCLTAPGIHADPPLAPLRSVRLTDSDVLITTGGTDTDPATWLQAYLPAPFAPTDDPHQWMLDADAPLPLADDAAAGLCAPFPTLVTIATAGPRTLMIDLEERRLLRVGGEPARCAALLRHVAAELASSRTAEDSEILLVGPSDDPGDDLVALNPEQIVVTDLTTALDEIDHRARATRDALDRHHLVSVVDGRRRNLAPDSWLPTVLLIARPLDDDEHARLAAIDLTGSAVAVAAVVTTAAETDLAIDSAGVLHLGDVTDGPWTAVALTTDAGGHLAALLGTTSDSPAPVRPLDHPAEWAAGMDEDGGLTDPQHTPDRTMAEPAHDRAPAEPESTWLHGDQLADDRTTEEHDAHGDDHDEDGASSGTLGEEEPLASGNAERDGTEPDDAQFESDERFGADQREGPADGAPVTPLPQPRSRSRADEGEEGEDVVDAPAKRRLAVVDHQDPSLDDDLAAWRAAGEPDVPMIAILGEPAVRAPGPLPRTRISWFTEILVYLALHPAGRTAQQAVADLWPEGRPINPSTIRHAFYGARRWAGGGLDGDPHRRFVSDLSDDTAYRLRGHLLDWDLFRRLRKRAQARHAAGHPGAVADYEAALRLIRGPVLSALRPGGYAWLNNHDQRQDLHIPGFLVDAAHELVDIALDAGDIATARRTAERARLIDVDVVFDRPLTDLMRVAHAEDNRAELELYATLLLDARGFDVPEELAPDSFAVLNTLLPHGLRRPGG